MAAVPIQQLANGHWELRYFDPAGRPRRTRFLTRQDAHDFRADLRAHPQRAPTTAPEVGSSTFEQWAARWCDSLVHLRPATRARYELEVRLHIVPRFGGAHLAAITASEVSGWVAEMAASGDPASAVRRRFSVLRKIFADALAMDVVPSNPCDGVPVPADRRSEVVLLGPEEVRELAGSINPWFCTWVWFAAYSGLHWSEMLGVRRLDLELVRRTVTVRQQTIEVHGRFQGFRQTSPPSLRTVDLPAFLCTMLEDQLRQRAQPGREGLVFVNTRGNPPHASNFTSQTWAKARAAIGRPDLSWNDLRHTAVALAISQGADLKTVQERMGHTSLTITLNRYGHLFPSLGRQVAEGLDRVYRQSVPALPTRSPLALPTNSGPRANKVNVRKLGSSPRPNILAACR